MNILANGRYILLALVFSMLTVSLAGCGGKQLPSQWSESKKEAFKQDIYKCAYSADGGDMELICKKYGLDPDADLPSEEQMILDGLVREVMMESPNKFKKAFPLE